MLSLNEHVAFSINGKTVSGTIVGIDQYSLESFDGKSRTWTSYTLTSKTKGIFSRFWITDWKSDGWILWTTAKKKNKLNLQMVPNRSGLSKIEFTGDQGISTPFSAVAVFLSPKDTYYALERFADSSVLYLCGQKISKPRKSLTSS